MSFLNMFDSILGVIKNMTHEIPSTPIEEGMRLANKSR